MHLSLNLRITKTFLGVLLAVLLVGAGSAFIYLERAHHNPLPNAIKSQVTFKVAYPAAGTAQISAAGYDYQSQQKVLSFGVNFAGADIAFNEQPAPGSLGSDTQVYYPALGIHPYAQFKTDAGLVALTKFWQSGNLKPFGQTAVLVSHGTLVTAHSDQNLTNQQWKDLFDSLKITR